MSGTTPKEHAPEIRRITLSDESIRNLNPDTVKAVAFAEVGANGNSEFLCLSGRDGDGILKITGHFGFWAFGKRYPGDVDIEVVEAKLPFLAHFRGMSRMTTIRGNRMVDGVWVHLSAGFGSHFFVRAELYEDFLRTFRESKAESLCIGAIPAALEVLKRLSSPDLPSPLPLRPTRFPADSTKTPSPPLSP